jgi:L-malate glycosyltransferase
MGTDSIEESELDIEALPWKEEYEVEIISRFDIGIYPLPDREFVLGKSSLKALQYMALGIPTVASAIGTNFRVIENNINGILAATDEEWIAALTELLSDEKRRQELGKSAAERVEKFFSVNANKKIYLNILDSVIAEKGE